MRLSSATSMLQRGSRQIAAPLLRQDKLQFLRIERTRRADCLGKEGRVPQHHAFGAGAHDPAVRVHEDTREVQDLDGLVLGRQESHRLPVPGAKRHLLCERARVTLHVLADPELDRDGVLDTPLLDQGTGRRAPFDAGPFQMQDHRRESIARHPLVVDVLRRVLALGATDVHARRPGRGRCD